MRTLTIDEYRVLRIAAGFDPPVLLWNESDDIALCEAMGKCGLTTVVEVKVGRFASPDVIVRKWIATSLGHIALRCYDAVKRGIPWS